MSFSCADVSSSTTSATRRRQQGDESWTGSSNSWWCRCPTSTGPRPSTRQGRFRPRRRSSRRRGLPGRAADAAGFGLLDRPAWGSPMAPGSVQGLHLVVEDIEPPARSWSGAASTPASCSTSARPAGARARPRAPRLQHVPHLQRSRRQHAGWCRRSSARMTESPRATADESDVRRELPSGTGASCTSTATACSPRSTRPRMRCRRRSCARGAAATASTAARCSGPGCTASPPTSASTCSRRRSRRVGGDALVRRGAVAAAVPRPAARRGRAERRAARRGRRRPGDDRAGVPRRHAGAAAAAARGADRARRARGGRRSRRRRCWRRAWPRPTARCSGPGRRCRSTCRAQRPSGRPASRAPRSGRCSTEFIDAHERCDAAAAMAIAAQDICGSRCRRTRAASRASTRSRPLLERAFGPSATATGGCCHERQPHAGRRQLPPPAGRHRVPGVQVRRPADRATARSPRSPPSARRSSRCSVCHRHSAVVDRFHARGERVVGRVRADETGNRRSRWDGLVSRSIVGGVARRRDRRDRRRARWPRRESLSDAVGGKPSRPMGSPLRR